MLQFAANTRDPGTWLEAQNSIGGMESLLSWKPRLSFITPEGGGVFSETATWRVDAASILRVVRAARLFRALRLTRGHWRKLARTVCLFVHFGSLYVPVAPLGVALSDWNDNQRG